MITNRKSFDYDSLVNYYCPVQNSSAYISLFLSNLHSLSKMERDHSQAINEHKTIVKQINKKTDTSIEGMKQQHSAAIAKV